MNNAPVPETAEPDRNSLALDRTILANERTYQAWLRTGMVALATGLGIARFLRDVMPPWLLLTIATILSVFSAVAFLLAAWRYNHLHVRMQHLDVDSVPSWIVRVFSLLLAGCSVLAICGLLAFELG